ncbi:MAG: ketoacyl-ACP synthase III [Rhizobiales bacterium]|nr:ketoacyl-ACP synthase III [Hyphomicrobiales bacterium]MBO6698963.1 ketoacyl-ACP synthase III [Hyphomicrobiales bacterium]MBO6734784.1 ketoacyl-ACP synthase III [Hyphomicrobiales bacterium]MBO6911410.1 ketoacyl-ACP synthase III [Hyphomicrobiales bacterium]MBO6955457.1 ketoacyl-ACP synthase III [Hyphomicrobiales bacterium]
MDTNPIYISTIRSVAGSRRVDNVQQSSLAGKDESFVEKRLGAFELAEATIDETATVLAKSAASNALSSADVTPEHVGLLIFVTQNPDYGGIPHNSAILQAELGLPTSAMCFDVGLGCSGYIYGLKIAAAIMATSDIETALIVTSDQYRSRLDHEDSSTRLIFGDGAAATVVSKKTGPLALRGYRFGTDGSSYDAIIKTNETIHMNGRGVFNFARSVMPSEIRAFMSDNNLGEDTIDALLLHQGSRIIVEEIGKKLALPNATVPVELEGIGNAVSSSIPLLLEKRLADPAMKTAILAGFGVGLSWGITWVERVK